jgi:hypothetical protein
LPWLVNRIDKEILKRLQDRPEVATAVEATVVRQQLENIDAKIASSF